MQILMTEAAFGRVGERLAEIAPGAEVVTAGGADAYSLNGAPIDKDLDVFEVKVEGGDILAKLPG